MQTFDEATYLVFKDAYNHAVREELKTFVFKGNTYLTEYAKYVVQMLQNKYEPKKNQNHGNR